MFLTFFYAMSLKKVILAATLVLPVLLYVFLEFFGSNNYEVQVYYQDTIPATDCYPTPEAPYRLDKSDAPTLYIALTARNNHLERTGMEAQRAREKYAIEVVGLTDLNEAPVAVPEGIKVSGMLPNRLVDYVGCKLLASTQGSDIFNYLILVDGDGHIRGYYFGGDDKEYERLLAEINILLSE